MRYNLPGKNMDKGSAALLLGPMVILLLFAVFIDSTEALGLSWGLFPDFFFGLWLMVKPKDANSEAASSQEEGYGDEEPAESFLLLEEKEDGSARGGRRAEAETNQPAAGQQKTGTKNEASTAQKNEKTAPAAAEPARHEPKHAKPQAAGSKNEAKAAKAVKKTKWLKRLRYFTFISGAIPVLSILPMWTILVWAEITSM